MAKINDADKLREDAVNHPERGKVNGKDILNEATERIEIKISRETYKRLLLNAASEGEAPSTAAARLVKLGLATDSERGKVADFLQAKSQVFGISLGEVISKIYGYRKRAVREARLKRQGTNAEPDSTFD